jgi:hypothetical protein
MRLPFFPLLCENVAAGASAEELGALHDRLEDLEICAGETCLTAEGP